MNSPRRAEVMVPLGDRSYRVVVGEGVRSELTAMLPAGARRVLVVTQEGVPQFAAGALDASELEWTTYQVGTGESHKTLATVEQVCRLAAEFGLNRQDVVVGVGGGMVTDIAGFAAASFHRGVAVVHMPTSLLGMIDAAVGGKTGVNLPEGKNLVGAFWQPAGVLCDVDALASLPEREMRCGYGEMAKYHFLTGEDLMSLPLVERIARCVEIKAEIVAADEREGGRRAVLNYGHTLGHALETATDHRLAHGEAVAVGLVYAAHLARRLGRIDDDRVDQHYDVVADGYGLAVVPPGGIDPATLVSLMGRDKKALDGLTFVLDGPNGVEVVRRVDPEVVAAALGDLVSGRPAVE